jgi:ectoine hydroxylase-related dioxygenase (phytanoyl-CoA dioxygenase family)
MLTDENPLAGHALSSVEDEKPQFATGFVAEPTFSVEEERARDRVFREIDRQKLERNAYELERDGFTILLPEQVAPASFIDALRDECIRVAERRTGPVDIATGHAQSQITNQFGQVQTEAGVLFENPLFEEALMNPAALALITYLLGESCILNHISTFLKGPGRDYLPLHSDQNRSSSLAPFTPYAQVANATWILTDYSKDDGSTCFVPGSHKLCRPPTEHEATDITLFRQPVVAPAGSILVWHGNTWHGAVPRTKAGVRVSLIAYFSRWYHQPIFPLEKQITPAMLSRNNERFAILTRATDYMNDMSTRGNLARFSQFA